MAFLRGLHVPSRPGLNSRLREAMIKHALDCENLAQALTDYSTIESMLCANAQDSTRISLLKSNLTTMQRAQSLRQFTEPEQSKNVASLKVADLFRFLNRTGAMTAFVNKKKNK